jgi:hypothetical protein
MRIGEQERTEIGVRRDRHATSAALSCAAMRKQCVVAPGKRDDRRATHNYTNKMGTQRRQEVMPN